MGRLLRAHQVRFEQTGPQGVHHIEMSRSGRAWRHVQAACNRASIYPYTCLSGNDEGKWNFTLVRSSSTRAPTFYSRFCSVSK